MRKIRIPQLPKILITQIETPSPKVKTQVKCKNCKKFFNPKKNSECRYHPEIPSTGLRVRNAYDEVHYPCCGKKDLGFNPVYEKADGCIVNEFHEAN
jgi:hypothetical protein